MPRAPVPFGGCGGTPHGRGSFCGAYGVRGSAVRARKRGNKTNRCRNKGDLYSDYVQKGRRYLVAPEPFGDGVRDPEEYSGRGSEESAARTYCCSGRTWTLLALRSFRSDLDSAASSCSGRRERRVKGAGMAGVPSQWEGTGQEKAGRPGFPRNGRERARRAEKAGKPGFPRNGRERARRKREGRGSLAMGGNGPGKRRKRESRGSLAMGGNGPGKRRKRVVGWVGSGVGVGAGARLGAGRGPGSE
jgi:hypothetical protein